MCSISKNNIFLNYNKIRKNCFIGILKLKKKNRGEFWLLYVSRDFGGGSIQSFITNLTRSVYFIFFTK